MKKQIFTVFLTMSALLAATGLFAQGYTGPGSASTGQGQIVTAAQAKELRDDARVTMQGTITAQLGREKYTFRDSSGEITLDIDRKIWQGLSIGENDRVEIYGEVDWERRGTQIEIDVKSIKKL